MLPRISLLNTQPVRNIVALVDSTLAAQSFLTLKTVVSPNIANTSRVLELMVQSVGLRFDCRLAILTRVK